jgi:hypothetical protein
MEKPILKSKKNLKKNLKKSKLNKTKKNTIKKQFGGGCTFKPIDYDTDQYEIVERNFMEFIQNYKKVHNQIEPEIVIYNNGRTPVMVVNIDPSTNKLYKKAQKIEFIDLINYFRNSDHNPIRTELDNVLVSSGYISVINDPSDGVCGNVRSRTASENNHEMFNNGPFSQMPVKTASRLHKQVVGEVPVNGPDVVLPPSETVVYTGNVVGRQPEQQRKQISNHYAVPSISQGLRSALRKPGAPPRLHKTPVLWTNEVPNKGPLSNVREFTQNSRELIGNNNENNDKKNL